MADLTKLTDGAVVAIMRQLLEELEAGHITVVEHALKNDEALVFSAAFAIPTVEVQHAQVALAAGKLCPKCSGDETTTAGGLDRLCLRCQHVWRPGP